MAKNESVLVANEAFVTEVDGERLTFSKGDAIEADHKAVKANPHLFGPLVFRHPIQQKRVEQATSAPGEKRNVRKSKPAAEPEPAKAKDEPEAKPTGKALTTDSMKGR